MVAKSNLTAAERLVNLNAAVACARVLMLGGADERASGSCCRLAAPLFGMVVGCFIAGARRWGADRTGLHQTSRRRRACRLANEKPAAFELARSQLVAGRAREAAGRIDELGR